jgi:hypothetical protein
MTYAWPTCEFAADSHLLKLHLLQNGVLRTSGNLPRRTPIRQKSYKITIMWMFETQAKAKPNTENIKGPDLVEIRHTIVQVSKLPQ